MLSDDVTPSFPIIGIYSDFYDCKIDNFQLKKCDIFLIFFLYHRLWVHFRTEYPQSMIKQKIRK